MRRKPLLLLTSSLVRRGLGACFVPWKLRIGMALRPLPWNRPASMARLCRSALLLNKRTQGPLLPKAFLCPPALMRCWPRLKPWVRLPLIRWRPMRRLLYSPRWLTLLPMLPWLLSHRCAARVRMRVTEPLRTTAGRRPSVCPFPLPSRRTLPSTRGSFWGRSRHGLRGVAKCLGRFPTWWRCSDLGLALL